MPNRIGMGKGTFHFTPRSLRDKWVLNGSESPDVKGRPERQRSTRIAACQISSQGERPSDEDAAGVRGATVSAFSPFRSRIFLAMWIASLLSNFGSLVQNVGATWLMTSLAPSADMVALVQVSTVLPIMLFSLPAGAAADVWDRRLIMLVAQVSMLAVSVALAVLAWFGA